MRLLKVEIKRILKTRLTIILLCATLLLTLLMAYLPITFPSSGCTYTDAQGNIVELEGLQGIFYKKKLQAVVTGTVTPEMARRAVENYQACLRKYGVETTYDLPDGVYDTEILPYAPLLRGIREVFADPNTGLAPTIRKLTPKRSTTITIYVRSVSSL